MSHHYVNDNSFRWLHLSDFHTGKDDLAQGQFFKQIFSEVRERVASGREPQAVFVTGDIANRGQEQEYEQFLEEFLFPLTDILQGEARSRIFFIPGNHDVDRKQDEAGQRYGILDKLPRILDPNNEGLHLREHLLQRFRSFAGFDSLSKKIDGTHWLLSSQGYYTHQFEIDRHSIGILCLNTAWFCEGDQDRLWLSPGEMMLGKGLEELEGCQIHIVLGHHPIDWFRPVEQRRTRALFGKYHVIYLHGHLHENTFTQEVGAGRPFVTNQAGASFQAREDKHEVNSFLWCELDYDRHTIRVEPRRWSRDNYEFSHAEPDFPEEYRARNDRGEELASYDLPLPLKAEQIQELPQAREFAPPPGWELITKEYLERQPQYPSEERLLQFFDGRLSDWNDALLPADVLVQRDIVGTLERMVKDARQKGTIQVIVLLGPAGEGKSIALRQLICNLIMSRTGWQVWWATEVDKNLALPIGAFSFPQSHDALLVVADDASLIAQDIYKAANFLRGQRKHIVFLLCSQTLAWRDAKADMLGWGQDMLLPIRFPAITEEEAWSIVGAWSKCGEQGLGALKDQPLEKAAEFFFQQTQSSGTTQGRSFFGAMLAARYGDGLQKHIHDILIKLQRMGSRGKALLEALAVICAVHCINDARGADHMKLSKDILAQFLGCKREEISSRYVLPLGDEAVSANISGGAIYSRHQEIAKVIVQLLPEFGIEFDDICRKLVHVICDLFAKKPSFVPDIQQWNQLPTWFFNQGIPWFSKDYNKQLGILLAEAFTEAEPNNPVSYVDLSKFHRAEKHPEISVKLLRQACDKVNVDRKYYYEWATAEGQTGNYYMDVCLCGISLADQADRKTFDDDRAILSLIGLSSCFADLFEETHHDPIFIERCASAMRLASAHIDRIHTQKRYDLEKGKRKCEQAGISYKNRSLLSAFETLQEGILEAYEQSRDALPNYIKDGEVTFHKLAQRLGIY